MAGVSRSATIVLSYLMKHHNLHLDEALNLVRDSRPIINPNHGFRAQLSEYEQMIRSKATIPSNRSHVMRKCRMNDCEYLSGNSLQEFVEDMWFCILEL
jgi:protein-tyrosine phosphatase